MFLGTWMRQNYYRNYMESEILSADPAKLVCLLYRGGLEQVRRARQCLRSGDIAGRSRAVSKATAILNELMLSVNRERGGDIARSLIELYDYMVRRLNEANFKQVDEPFAETEQLLSTLGDAWEQCAQASGTGGTAGANAVYAPVSCAG